MEFDVDVDARGLSCPLPILRAKKADKGSLRDFQAFAKQTGNELLQQDERENEYEFYLRRK
ncbi:MAG: SirA family protein [Burkholderiaceae bacterium]|nr:SirA family protein [Burkholderiaceae bacterium]